MKKQFINLSYQFILKYQECDDLKKKKLLYGLEGFYNLATKTLVLLLISIILNIWKEYLLLILIYSLVRMFTFGLHAKTTLMCWLTTTPIYIGGCLLIKNISIPKSFMIGVALFSFISFFLWAPADTPAKPLIRENRRKLQKMGACAINILFLFILIYFNHSIINNTICYSLFIQSIVINPLTYMITHTTFNNYKLYAQKMV